MTGSRDTGGTASYPSYAVAVAGLNPIVDLRDNSLYNTQTSAGTGAFSYALGVQGYGLLGNLTSNYNDLYTSGPQAHFSILGNLTNTGLGDRLTLAAWQAGTGKDTNSINADPLYTNPTNLQPLSGSPLFGAGQTIPGIATDITGAARGNPPVSAPMKVPT